MAIQMLEIDFRGICTHFHHNFVPGIPHRVVLPKATDVFPGQSEHGVGHARSH